MNHPEQTAKERIPLVAERLHCEQTLGRRGRHLKTLKEGDQYKEG